jgi:4-amino-4-deoxy-L-arabinose transferase-like glycosyltransferase
MFCAGNADQNEEDMAQTATEEPAAETVTRAERKFRAALWIVSTLALVALICCVFTAFRSVNDFSPAESVIAAQSMMLVDDGTLYYDLNRYPYTVCAYMPIFYLIEAGLFRAHFTAFHGGRAVSIAAWCGLVAMVWNLVLLYTSDRNAAWLAAILAASSSLLLFWGSIAQTDTLAVFFAVTAFFQFSKFYVRGEATLIWAGVFAALALFTKQTMLAAPAAIFVALLLRDRKRAMWFAILFGGAVGGAVLMVNHWLHGDFLADTVRANMNPMSWKKVADQLLFFGSVSGCMVLIAAAGFARMIRTRGVAVCIYLLLAACVFLATAPKIGSDTNYQIELTTMLAVACGIGLHELDFFPLLFQGSKKWVPLLLLPLAVHAAVGLRATANNVIFRWATENQSRAAVDELRPYVAPAGGRVLSSDYNAMVRLRERIDVETFIYSMLVSAGAVDPERVRRDLARAAFSTVILGENVFEPKRALDLELRGLPESQLAEIRTHYRLVKHVDGPFIDGDYVYLPIP